MAVIWGFFLGRHQHLSRKLRLSSVLSWWQRDLASSISCKIRKNSKPYTRMNILSTINCKFDPLGFLAPVIMQGKSIIRPYLKKPQTGMNHYLQTCTSNGISGRTLWKTLKPYLFQEWTLWFLDTIYREYFYLFCDVSKTAISAVANAENQGKCGFLVSFTT